MNNLSKVKIAVVILNWNGKKLLQQFLPSVIKHSTSYSEVYVADNNSDDDSISHIKNNFPEIKVIHNPENGGYAKGYNDALQYVDADIYALVNSDIEVTEGWLQPIIKQFEQNSNVAAIQPKILDFKDKTKFEYAGAAGGFIDSFGYLYCRGRIFDTIERDNEQYNDNANIFWASGACFFIRSSVFHKVKGFDSDFFAHQEEVDLCWRIQNEGYKIQYNGQSTVYHVGGATLSNLNPKKTYLNFRNSLYMLIKNLPNKGLFTTILLRLILDGIAAVKFLIALQPKHFLAVLKAHYSFYYNLPKYLDKRKLQTIKTTNFSSIRSLIWSYFILGKKTYSKLNK